MKKLIVILCLFLAGGSLFSQNPGYMGRHVLLNMEVYISPSWRNPNSLAEAMIASGMSGKAANYLGLNYFLSPNLEVIVWRKGTVGAGYNFYKSPFVLSRSYSGSLLSYNYEVSEKPMMTAHGFNVFYKQYLGSTMAPMGQYLKFTFDGFFYSYKVPDAVWQEYVESRTSWDETSPVIDETPTGKSKLFAFKVEYGYDFFVLDCLKMSMGVSLGTTFGGYKAINRERYDYSVTDYADNRLLNAYWFGIKLGLGFLTF
jgi:hypothetical protein